jgi:acyl-CoA synthetase (NDP forming)
MTESLQGDARDILVQRMVTPGVDVRVRCRHDDHLGVVVNVGLGGEQADAIGDKASRLAPLSPAGARSMINDTRVATALEAGGFDPSPLVDVIVQTAQLAADHDEIEELDLNPVIVSDDGAVATDAHLRLRRHADARAPIRRLD